MTQIGVLLGTAAYMSPEQAKGRPADKRSDVWAFGCVFYEMLTGTRAFAEEDISETLAAILKSEPDWTRIPSDVPQAIRTLIQRCLVKDRRLRVADISAAKFVLCELGNLGTRPATANVAAAPRSRWQRVLPPLAAAARDSRDRRRWHVDAAPSSTRTRSSRSSLSLCQRVRFHPRARASPSRSRQTVRGSCMRPIRGCFSARSASSSLIQFRALKARQSAP